MRVRIDEAGSDRQAVNLKRAFGRAAQAPDFDNLAVGQSDIGVIARQPGAVVNSAALKHEIVHGVLLRQAEASRPVRLNLLDEAAHGQADLSRGFLAQSKVISYGGKDGTRGLRS